MPQQCQYACQSTTLGNRNYLDRWGISQQFSTDSRPRSTTSRPEPGRPSPKRTKRNTLRNRTELDPSCRSRADRIRVGLSGTSNPADRHGAGPTQLGRSRADRVRMGRSGTRCGASRSRTLLGRMDRARVGAEPTTLRISTEPDLQRLGRRRAGAQADDAGHAGELHGSGPCWAGAGRAEPESDGAESHSAEYQHRAGPTTARPALADLSSGGGGDDGSNGGSSKQRA